MQIGVREKCDQTIVSLASAGGEAPVDVNCFHGGEIVHACDSTGQSKWCAEIQEQIVSSSKQTGSQSQSSPMQIGVTEKCNEPIVGLAAAGGEAAIDIDGL